MDKTEAQAQLASSPLPPPDLPKHITWRCARHSFGVNLLIMKNDVKTVSGLLGHSSIRMTEVYTRFVDELKKEAVDSLPDIFEKPGGNV